MAAAIGGIAGATDFGFSHSLIATTRSAPTIDVL
jgi:hypothetical protein